MRAAVALQEVRESIRMLREEMSDGRGRDRTPTETAKSEKLPSPHSKWRTSPRIMVAA